MYRRQIKQRSRVGFDVHNYNKSQNQYGTSSPHAVPVNIYTMVLSTFPFKDSSRFITALLIGL